MKRWIDLGRTEDVPSGRIVLKEAIKKGRRVAHLADLA